MKLGLQGKQQESQNIFYAKETKPKQLIIHSKERIKTMFFTAFSVEIRTQSDQIYYLKANTTFTLELQCNQVSSAVIIFHKVVQIRQVQTISSKSRDAFLDIVLHRTINTEIAKSLASVRSSGTGSKILNRSTRGLKNVHNITLQ